MAGYNQILGEFWNDDYVLDQLDGTQRFVYNLLLTGPFVNSAGIYKITETQISMYVGAERKVVHEALQKLIADGKISYDGQALYNGPLKIDQRAT